VFLAVPRAVQDGFDPKSLEVFEMEFEDGNGIVIRLTESSALHLPATQNGSLWILVKPVPE